MREKHDQASTTLHLSSSFWLIASSLRSTELEPMSDEVLAPCMGKATFQHKQGGRARDACQTTEISSPQQAHCPISSPTPWP